MKHKGFSVLTYLRQGNFWIYLVNLFFKMGVYFIFENIQRVCTYYVHGKLVPYINNPVSEKIFEGFRIYSGFV